MTDPVGATMWDFLIMKLLLGVASGKLSPSRAATMADAAGLDVTESRGDEVSYRVLFERVAADPERVQMFAARYRSAVERRAATLSKSLSPELAESYRSTYLSSLKEPA